ncbi:carbohydrate ABC transporter permease [Corynebacterium choanae]|uniref:Lactose transport system permease protein LacF n=1 Tax=Corynebacterium choanae TaxID=1862358 RepID=A0A3G6J818_9CORY|nr:sugar ABC transporter permease [Corynebacterium choanae]AZA12590.1 Lactose transport system permease protein LacF [Corynebacterium choanae]
MTTPTTAPPARSNEAYIRARARRRAMYGWIFLAPFAFLFLIVFIVPIFVSAYEAFFQMKVSGGGAYGGGELSRQFVGLENFRNAVTAPNFWRGMGRVFLFGIVQIPIMILIALVLALVLDSVAARHQKLYRLLYFLPYAIPGIIAAIIWIYLYTPDVSPIFQLFGISPNLFDHNVVLWSMANVTTWTYTGYNMLIFYSALQSVPTELYEAARIDGASEWQLNTKIKIPMLSSAVLLTVLLSIIGTIQLFNEPAMFQKVAALPSDYMPMLMALAIKNNQVTVGGVSGAGPAAAVSLVMAIIAGVLALLYALIQRKVAPSND